MSATRTTTTDRTGQTGPWTTRRVAALVKELRDGGESLRAITSAMKARGIPAPWREGWTMTTVRVLTGEWTFDDLGIGMRGEHDDASPEELAEAAARARQYRPGQREARLARLRTAAREALWREPILPATRQPDGRLAAWCPLCERPHLAGRSYGMAPWRIGSGGSCFHADAPSLVVLAEPWEWQWWHGEDV